MPSTYTLNNGIELIATGEQSGTWGDTTNTNLELLDTSLDGQVTVTLASTGSSGSPNTLPVSDGAASNGRNRLVIFDDSSDLGGTAFVQLTPNDAEKIIYVRNSLSGSRSILLFQGTYSASNDYEVPAGTTAVVFFNGAGAGAVAANVFNNAHFDALNVVGGGAFGGAVTVTTGDSGATAASNADDLVVEASGDGGISILNPATNTGTLFFGDPSAANAGQIKYSHTDDAMSIVTAQNTAITIDSSRRVLIGNGLTSRGSNVNLQVEGTTFAGGSASFTRNSNDTSSGALRLTKSRGTAVGSHTIVQDDDQLGTLQFQGTDGTNAFNAADIIGFVDGTPGLNDMPGRLVFRTTSDGANSPTERMTITNAGNVGIGTSGPVKRFVVNSGDNREMHFFESTDVMTMRATADSGSYTLRQMGLEGSEVIFKTQTTANVSGVEAMRINSNRNILVGIDTQYSQAGAAGIVEMTGAKTTAMLTLGDFGNNSGGGIISVGTSRSTTRGVVGTSVQNGDTLMDLRIAADDGTDMNSTAANIRAHIDAAPGSNDTPGRLTFGTTADGAASPTERMRIDNAGNVGINTTAPSDYTANGNNLVVADVNVGITLASTSTVGSGALYFADGTSGSQAYRGIINYLHSSDAMGFHTGAAQAMTIDSGQRVLIGYTANISTADHNAALQVVGQGTADFHGATASIIGFSNNSNGAYLNFASGRSNTAGTYTIVANDDTVGQINFAAADGTDMASRAAFINVNIDGAPSANDTPGRIIFGTTADGASSPTERMRITSAGLVGIGEQDPDSTLQISNSSSVPSITLGRTPYSSHGNLTIGGTGTGHITSNMDEAGDSTVNVRASRVAVGNGEIDFQNSPQTAAGSARTFTTRLKVDEYGGLTIASVNATAAVFGGTNVVNGITAVPSPAGTPFVLGRDTGTTRSAHFGGHLKFDSGYGIDFSATGDGSGTATSELLHDYEEGTWTPVYSTSGGGQSVTYNNQFGIYTKIGNLVTIHMNLDITSATNIGSGDVIITGLPYATGSTASTANYNRSTFSTYGIDYDSTDGTQMHMYLPTTNVNKLQILYSQDNAAWVVGTTSNFNIGLGRSIIVMGSLSYYTDS